MNSQKEIENLLDRLEVAIKESQSKKGILASGKSAQSLRYVATSTEGILFGAGYFYQQENGRQPGKYPPFKAIYDWLEFKKYGLDYKDDNERKSLAFAIINNIKKKGTWIYQGKSKGLEIAEIIKIHVAKFKEDLKEEGKNEITVNIKNILKK